MFYTRFPSVIFAVMRGTRCHTVNSICVSCNWTRCIR